MIREEIVARARALIGVRFRPQGRDPADGLDCIGVAMMAAGVAGDRVRRDYCLHSSEADGVNLGFGRCGFVRIARHAARAGDLMLVRPGRTALHVVILTGTGYLHADMRLRKVVEVPGPVPWPIVSVWRRTAQAADDAMAAEPVAGSREAR